MIEPKFSFLISHKMWLTYWDHYKVSEGAKDLVISDKNFENQITAILSLAERLEIDLSDSLDLRISGSRSEIMKIIDKWMVKYSGGQSYLAIDDDELRHLVEISFDGPDLFGEPVEFLVLVEDYN